MSDNIPATSSNVLTKADIQQGPKALINHAFTRQQIARALGNSQGADRFCRVCLTLLNGNWKLCDMAERNPTSFIASCIELAQAGLDPSIPNECSLIPWAGKTNAVRPMYGYKGLIKLALRAAVNSGNPLKTLNHEIIYENDFFEYWLGANPKLNHRPAKFGTPRGPAIGYYACAEDSAGRLSMVVLDKEAAEKHKARYNRDDKLMRDKDGKIVPELFDRWAAKTVLRLLINRYLSMDAALGKAVRRDIEIETGEESGSSIDAEYNLQGELDAPPPHIDREYRYDLGPMDETTRTNAKKFALAKKYVIEDDLLISKERIDSLAKWEIKTFDGEIPID